MLKKWARSALMGLTLSALIGAILPVAGAVEITIACGAVGIESRLCREGTESWAAATGHRVRLIQSPNLSNNRLALFQQMLAAGSSDVDLFQIDVIWPGILATHLIDLHPYYGDEQRQAHWKTLIDNNTIGGELKAIPWFTDIGLLYYRSDLLDKYGLPVPETWSQLASAAMWVIDAEREAGRVRITGFVFQARAYEGLTCNALEWIASYGGDYIESHPTIDRIAETIEKLSEDIYGRTCPPTATRHAFVHFCPPIDLDAYRESFARKARLAVRALTAACEQSVQKALDRLNAANPHTGGKLWNETPAEPHDAAGVHDRNKLELRE